MLPGLFENSMLGVGLNSKLFESCVGYLLCRFARTVRVCCGFITFEAS